MPEIWSNPQEFDPDRFSDERAEHKRAPFAYLPFGGGAHTCLGGQFATMQAKAILYQRLRRYRLKLLPGYNPKHQLVPMPKPKDDLPLVLERIR